MEYIDNDKQKGVLYDFAKINKKFKKLKIPKNVYSPLTIPFTKAKWHVILSERSRGKTTNLLLYGMVMNQEYGTVIQYIRQRKDHIAPKRAGELFTTILEFDYVQKLTNGRWNSLVYKSKRWYYCNRDEDGNETERAPEHFMYMLSLDEAEMLKSSYNAPMGDFILYDEFLSSKYYYQNEFVTLTDVIKTIVRDRLSPIIILSANQVDKHSTYFHELEIADEIALMKSGDEKIVTTARGTNVYVNILSQGELFDANKKASNRLFFGFSNPLLANITGGDWAIDNYPHIEREEREIVLNNRFIEHNNKLVKLELVHNEKRGLHVLVHWATRYYEDSIIYTTHDIPNRQYKFRCGHTKTDKLLWNLHEKNLFFYMSNDIGSFVDNFLRSCNN